MQMLDIAWGKVKADTVVNCFAKAGISKEKQTEALQGADNPFKDLQEQLDTLAIRTPDFFPEGATANYFVSADDHVISTEPVMTDDQIINDVLVDENVIQEDADENFSDRPTCPKSGDVRRALDILRVYMLFSDNGEALHKSINQISAVVENSFSVRLRQAAITNFFQ